MERRLLASGDGIEPGHLAFLEGISRAATVAAVMTTDGAGGRAGITISLLTSTGWCETWWDVVMQQKSPRALILKGFFVSTGTSCV